jgi:lysozyme family protein
MKSIKLLKNNKATIFIWLGVITFYLVVKYNFIDKPSDISPNKTFNHAFEFVIKNEGGYVLDPDDKGGETFAGISKKTYPDLDIQNLKLNDIKEIYHRDFWENSFVSKIQHPEIAIKFFDLSVLTGVKQASLIFQRCIIAAGQQIILDGEVGEQTLNAFNKIKNYEGFIWLMRAESIAFFYQILDHSPSQKKFLLGWIARVFRTPKLS